MIRGCLGKWFKKSSEIIKIKAEHNKTTNDRQKSRELGSYPDYYKA